MCLERWGATRERSVVMKIRVGSHSNRATRDDASQRCRSIRHSQLKLQASIDLDAGNCRITEGVAPWTCPNKQRAL